MEDLLNLVLFQVMFQQYGIVNLFHKYPPTPLLPVSIPILDQKFSNLLIYCDICHNKIQELPLQ